MVFMGFFYVFMHGEDHNRNKSIQQRTLSGFVVILVN